MPASGREERMSTIAAVGTYLPPWTRGAARVAGPDEDAVTCGVAAGRAAGRAALSGASSGAVQRVIFVTRATPLLEGGSGAALLAGLGLEPQLTVIEQVGGGAAALGAVADSAPGTLVVAADCPPGAPAGAAAVLTGARGLGPELSQAGQITRSLPVRARGGGRVGHDSAHPRLPRERAAAAAPRPPHPTPKPHLLA